MSRRSVFYPKGKERSIKIINALISLLFLVAIAAVSSALPLDSDSSNCAVTEASPSLAGKWIEKANTNKSGAFGEAVVGTDDYIYIAWCRNNTTQPQFWRYDPNENEWNYSMSNSSLPKGAFRNGAALDGMVMIIFTLYPAGDMRTLTVIHSTDMRYRKIYGRK